MIPLRSGSDTVRFPTPFATSSCSIPAMKESEQSHEIGGSTPQGVGTLQGCHASSTLYDNSRSDARYTAKGQQFENHEAQRARIAAVDESFK